MAPKCSSCRGLFDSCKRLPLLLPNCGHSCCKACLVRLVQHRGYLCSICRTKQGVSDVDDLHVNHSLLEEILSMHWSLLQCLTTQAQVLVFVDLQDSELGDTRRVYIDMASQHSHSQHFLRLCAGHGKASFLNSALTTRREDSNLVVVVLAALNGIEVDKEEGAAPKQLQKGDVVSLSGKVTQVCVVMEARPGATLACTCLGKVTSGLDAVIKSNGNLAKGKICVKDCGLAWKI